ncbi:MAG: hypothetical protein JSU97_07805, partial [Dehalococcoidia bacterium]
MARIMRIGRRPSPPPAAAATSSPAWAGWAALLSLYRKTGVREGVSWELTSLWGNPSRLEAVASESFSVALSTVGDGLKALGDEAGCESSTGAVGVASDSARSCPASEGGERGVSVAAEEGDGTA